MTRGETPAHDFEKKDWSLDTDRSREHGQKRGGGPQGTAPASPQQPEGRRYYATGGLRRRLEPGVSREGQLSIPSIQYQLTAWASIGGGRREKRKGPSCPVPTAQENSTPLRGDCTGKGGKCFLPAHPFKRDQGRPHATPGGYMVALAPLLHPVGIRMAGAGLEVLPCPFSPQREDFPRPPERRLRERLRPRTRLRSSPSSSSSAS